MDLTGLGTWVGIPEVLLGIVFLAVLTDKLVVKVRLIEERVVSAKFEKAYKEEKAAHQLTIKAHELERDETLTAVVIGLENVNTTLDSLRKRAGELSEDSFSVAEQNTT